MRYPQAEQSRQLLDAALRADNATLARLGRPTLGWIRTIREALQMPQRELARRLGVSQPSVQALERREVSGSITLETLERAADALGCDLVYAMVPRRSLEDVLHEQAEKVARIHWRAVEQTMALEDQPVSSERSNIVDLTHQALSSGTAVWLADD